MDYSVGGRWQERGAAPQAHRTRLALLRWPDSVLALDDGEVVRTCPP